MSRSQASYPDALRRAEAGVSAPQKRAAPAESYGAEATASESPARPDLAVALSGGGIRSATLSLGFFQGLARTRRILGDVRLLSTVSGGSYFGSFYTALWRREPVQSIDMVEDVLTESANPFAGARISPLQWLRENSRFLAPRGGGDLLLAGASTVRNMLAVLLIWLLPIFAAFLLLVGLQGYLAQSAWLPPAWRVVFAVTGGHSGWIPLALLALLGVLLPLGALYFTLPTRERDPLRRFRTRLLRTALALIPVLTLSATLLIQMIRTDLLTQLPALLLLGTLALTHLLLIGVAPASGQAWGRERVGNWVGAILSLALGAWLIVCGTVQAWVESRAPGSWHTVTLVIALAASMGMLAFLVAGTLVSDLQAPEDVSGDATRVAVAEHRLSVHFTRVAVLVALLCVAGLIDSLGFEVALMLNTDTGTTALGLGALITALSALAAQGERLLGSLRKLLGDRFAVPIGLVVAALALLLWGAILIGTSALVYAITLSNDGGGVIEAWREALLGGSIAAVIVLAIGTQTAFANFSSLHPLYRARLARTYVGASNPTRLGSAEAPIVPATELIDGDDLNLAADMDARRGVHLKPGQPLHLINVTINETVDTRMGTQSQDRKGVHMAVSPAGISVSTRHHGVYAGEAGSGRVRVEAVDGAGTFHALGSSGDLITENATLSNWTAISGAAASTGMGSRTSIAFSLLMGLLNVRLGYWWDAGVDGTGGLRAPPPSVSLGRRLLVKGQPMYAQLLDELLARFRGTCQRYWNLSDGGHFENLGIYELLRRRPRLIIGLDNGEDADSRFEDLAGLIRKARLDFAAEIRFLDHSEMAALLQGSAAPADPQAWCLRLGLGTLAELRRVARDGYPPISKAVAALAWIDYGDGERSLLLYVKSAFHQPESAPDLLNYLRDHPSFPHESTADQFFDEAQWESYRRLGDLNAQQLFRSTGSSVDLYQALRTAAGCP